jgi:hypothetical protein
MVFLIANPSSVKKSIRSKKHGLELKTLLLSQKACVFDAFSDSLPATLRLMTRDYPAGEQS